MDWLYDGVNKTVPRNAGPECASFMYPLWRKIETVLVLLLGSIIFVKSYPEIKIRNTPQARNIEIRPGQRLLLILMSIIWGMEIGYKFSSRTVIYLLNPCHVTTAIQIYLLAATPSKFVTGVFRFHLNLLNGPLLAFLFPETDTRLLPLEFSIYWIQHGMMFVVPYYLLRIDGVYNIEPYSDMSWSIFSYSINLLYHFSILQFIAIPTEVNLNHMLCPAIMDPFEGQLYRICAIVHQAILCPVLCKLYCFISDYFITKCSITKVNNMLDGETTLRTTTDGNNITITNGNNHHED